MKQSNYINFLIKELGTHLYRTSDFEREAYYKVAQNMSTPNLLINYKSTHLRDFFDFYLKDLEFTPQDFIKSLNDDRRLMEVLYSQYYSFLTDRKELQEIFEPVIRQNPNLFLLALNNCLDTHHNSYDMSEKNPHNQEILAQIERNTEQFKKLLDIGEYENMFRKIPSEALYTKNSVYKNIIQEKGLLENESFDEAKLIELFEEVANNSRNRNFNKVAEYCIFYIKDIVKKFDYPGTFNAWAATHINNKKDKEDRLITLMDDKSFFNLITDQVNGESKQYQNSFIDRWLDNSDLRKSLITGYSSDLSFLKSHPDQISTFLSKLSEQDKVDLFNSGRNEFDFDRSYSGFGSFLNKIPLEHASPVYHAEIIDKVIDFRKSKYNSDDLMADNALFSAALNYLVHKSLKIIKHSILSDEDKEKHKLEVLNVYVKNSDVIVSLIHNGQNAINKHIGNLDSNLKELRFSKKDLNLPSNFFNDLESLASGKLEHYFLKKTDEYGHTSMRGLIESVNNSIKVVSALGIYSALDKLDLISVKIDKEIKTYDRKKSKHLYDYPAIFDIVDNTEDKGILSWVFQEKNVPALKEAVYKNKNIVEFFAAVALESKSSKPTIEKMFEVMMENKSVLNELVLAKKKTMKAVQELDNEFIQLSLNVADLDKSLAQNKEPVKRTSNKL